MIICGYLELVTFLSKIANYPLNLRVLTPLLGGLTGVGPVKSAASTAKNSEKFSFGRPSLRQRSQPSVEISSSHLSRYGAY